MSFLNPSLLYLLPIAGIPIIIHLLHRMRLKRINFSSLFFLRATKRERFAWLKIREFLLLLFRTAFLFFLLLSLAKPQCEKSPFRIESERSVIILLDDTYSMRAKSAGKENFFWAKERIERLFSVLTPHSEVALFLLSGRLSTNFLPRDSIIKILDTLSCSYLSPRLLGEEVGKIINSARYPVDLYLFTDCQKNLLPLLKGLEKILPKNLELKVLAIGERIKNSGITSVHWRERLALPGEANHIAVKVKNYSEEEIILRLTLKEEKIREFLEVLLKPKEEREITFNPELRETRDYFGKVEISDDSLLVDNIRYFVLPKLEKIPVLLLFEDKEKASFLEKAIAPSALSPFSLTSSPVSGLKGINLSAYKVVILFDPINLTKEDKVRIMRYWQGGGSLFFCLFSPPKVSLWEEYFTYEGNKREEGFLRVEKADSLHPALGVLKEEIKNFRIFAYSLIKPKTLKPILVLSGGIPFLLEGKERVIVATTLFHPDFTDLVYKGIFIPLLYPLLFHLAYLPLNNEFLCGDTIKFSSFEPILLAKTPFGNFTVNGIFKEGKMEYQFSQTHQPGIYELGKNKFSVNPDPKEGDLSQWEKQELERLRAKLIKEIPLRRIDLTSLTFYLAFFSLLFEFLLLTL